MLICTSSEVSRSHQHELHTLLHHTPGGYNWNQDLWRHGRRAAHCGCWVLISTGFGSWSVACKSPWRAPHCLHGEQHKNWEVHCWSELRQKPNSKTICLNSPGHCILTNLLSCLNLNCTLYLPCSVSIVYSMKHHMEGKNPKPILEEERCLVWSHFKIYCTFNFTLSFYVSFNYFNFTCA